MGMEGTVLSVYHRPSAWKERRQYTWGIGVDPVYILWSPFQQKTDRNSFVDILIFHLNHLLGRTMTDYDRQSLSV